MTDLLTKNKKESPATLYKFRDWNNSYHRKMLSNNELFFANNKAFDDPYDFDLPLLDIYPFDRQGLKNMYTKHKESAFLSKI